VLFLLKNCKNRRALGALPPNLRVTGGWMLRTQILISLRQLTSSFIFTYCVTPRFEKS